MGTGDAVGGCLEQPTISLSLNASLYETEFEIKCHGSITRRR